MKEWWQSLNQREQILIGGGSAALLLVILYLFVWSPFTAGIAVKKSYVTYQQNLVDWMQEADAHLIKLRSTGDVQTQKIDNSQLLSTVDSTLQQANLNAYSDSIQQTSNNKVLVKFKNVPFDIMIAWIDRLWKQHAIKVEQISIKPDASTRGIVTAEVFFTVNPN